jgi:hypothetical protein
MLIDILPFFAANTPPPSNSKAKEHSEVRIYIMTTNIWEVIPTVYPVECHRGLNKAVEACFRKLEKNLIQDVPKRGQYGLMFQFHRHRPP